MNDRPSSWEELRNVDRVQATEAIPDAIRSLVNDERPPTREIRFVERRGSLDEDRGPITVDPHRPPWADGAYAPRKTRIPKPPTLLHHDQQLEPVVTYLPDDRTIYNDRSYPWGCICKITTASGFVGSGVLIGPRHVLTASHVVDWSSSDAEKIEVHLTGTVAAATAYDTIAYAFTKISGDPTVTTLDEDYACLVLDRRLGDAFGWMGTKTYDSDWDGDNVWSSIGYPGDVAQGLQPTYILNKSMDEDEWDYGSGRAMTTAADMQKGQSGSPMFAWWDGSPYVVAVMSAYGNVWASGLENWCSGGSDLGRLVTQARNENP